MICVFVLVPSSSHLKTLIVPALGTYTYVWMKCHCVYYAVGSNTKTHSLFLSSRGAYTVDGDKTWTQIHKIESKIWQVPYIRYIVVMYKGKKQCWLGG